MKIYWVLNTYYRSYRINYNKKYPLLLRNESLFTQLIILFTYEYVNHGGVEIALCRTGEKFS